MHLDVKLAKPAIGNHPSAGFGPSSKCPITTLLCYNNRLVHWSHDTEDREDREQYWQTDRHTGRFDPYNTKSHVVKLWLHYHCPDIYHTHVKNFILQERTY